LFKIKKAKSITSTQLAADVAEDFSDEYTCPADAGGVGCVDRDRTLLLSQRYESFSYIHIGSKAPIEAAHHPIVIVLKLPVAIHYEVKSKRAVSSCNHFNSDRLGIRRSS
jgi:hypothetical protein